MRTINVTRPIVVGVDGSPGSLHAVSYAASLAGLLRKPLALVSAYRGAPIVDPVFPAEGPRPERFALTAVAYAPYSAGVSEEVFRLAAERALDTARQQVAETHRDVGVTTEAIHGAAGRVLSNASRFAFLVVIGRSQSSPAERILTGSTVSAVLAHAIAPTIVVPPDWSPSEGTGGAAELIAGVEGAASEAAVLQFAFGVASDTGAHLTVLHANRFLEFAHGDYPTLEEEAALISEADRRIMAESIAGWGEIYPDVQVETAFSMEGPAQALVERSKRAELVVVGARARTGFPWLHLGSTARAVALHATCPVAVIRPMASRTEDREAESDAEVSTSLTY